MGLKKEEIANLAPMALELGQLLVAAFGAESDGGKRVTRGEIKEISVTALKLATRIIRDVLD